MQHQNTMSSPGAATCDSMQPFIHFVSRRAKEQGPRPKPPPSSASNRTSSSLLQSQLVSSYEEVFTVPKGTNHKVDILHEIPPMFCSPTGAALSGSLPLGVHLQVPGNGRLL